MLAILSKLLAMLFNLMAHQFQIDGECFNPFIDAHGMPASI